MIGVKVGDVLETKNKKYGMSKAGEYFVFDAMAEDGKDRISIFAADPRAKGLKESKRVKILSIMDAKATKRRVNNQWYRNFAICCEVEPILEDEKTFNEFMAGPTEEEINALFGL